MESTSSSLQARDASMIGNASPSIGRRNLPRGRDPSVVKCHGDTPDSSDEEDEPEAVVAPLVLRESDVCIHNQHQPQSKKPAPNEAAISPVPRRSIFDVLQSRQGSGDSRLEQALFARASSSSSGGATDEVDAAQSASSGVSSAESEKGAGTTRLSNHLNPANCSNVINPTVSSPTKMAVSTRNGTESTTLATHKVKRIVVTQSKHHANGTKSETKETRHVLADGSYNVVRREVRNYPAPQQPTSAVQVQSTKRQTVQVQHVPPPTSSAAAPVKILHLPPPPQRPTTTPVMPPAKILHLPPPQHRIPAPAEPHPAQHQNPPPVQPQYQRPVQQPHPSQSCPPPPQQQPQPQQYYPPQTPHPNPHQHVQSPQPLIRKPTKKQWQKVALKTSLRVASRVLTGGLVATDDLVSEE